MNTLIISLLAYLLILFGLSFFYNRRQSVGSYFINLKHTHLGVMTMSLVSAVLGASVTIVVISEVYNTGISYGLAFLIYSIFGMIMLATCATQIKTFGDIYKATTIPEFFGRRFNKQTKYLTSIVLVLSILFFTAIQLIVVSALLTTALGVPYWVSLLLVASMRLAYTTIGGFKFGLFTDFLNGWVLLFIFSFLAVTGLVYSLHHTPAPLPASFASPVAYAGIWWLIGKIILGGFAQVGSAVQWQRIVSADNAKTVEKSFKLAIPIIFILGVIIIFLGLLSYQFGAGQTQDHAFFSLIGTLLPPWLAGIVLATIVAVFATALDNQIIAGSAIVYGLFYQQHDLTERESVLKARLITAILSILAFIIAIFQPSIVHLQSLTNHIALIIGPVLVATLFSTNKKSNEAIFWSMAIPTIALCIIYPFLHSDTFIITAPLALIIFNYYDKWTTPKSSVYR